MSCSLWESNVRLEVCLPPYGDILVVLWKKHTQCTGEVLRGMKKEKCCYMPFLAGNRLAEKDRAGPEVKIFFHAKLNRVRNLFCS